MTVHYFKGPAWKVPFTYWRAAIADGVDIADGLSFFLLGLPLLVVTIPYAFVVNTFYIYLAFKTGKSRVGSVKR